MGGGVEVPWATTIPAPKEDISKAGLAVKAARTLDIRGTEEEAAATKVKLLVNLSTDAISKER